MNGYQLIMNLKDKERADLLGINENEAKQIQTMTVEELRRNDAICLETMKRSNRQGECIKKLSCCYDCRKEFLENEI